MTPWPEPPRWLVGWGIVLVAVAAGVVVLGAFRIGVTVDETFHVVRLQNYFDHGWYLLDDDLGASGPGSWVPDAFVYGPVTTLFLHVLNVVAGQESWGHVSASADAYVVRHLGVVFLGLLAVAATAAMARLVSGSWRWGVLAAATLGSLPMWTGHAMFNVKDVPVATGYTLVTLGSMLWLTWDPGRRRYRVGAAGLVASGVLLTVGTRPALWFFLGVSVAWALAHRTWWQPGARREGRRWVWVDAVVALGVPLALLAVIYPSVFAQFPGWLAESLLNSGDNQMVRSRGHLPYAVATTVPLLLLLVMFVGGYGRLRAWLSARPMGVQQAMVVLLCLQAFLLPVMLVVKSAAVSGGLRHVLSATPAIAVLVCAGLAQFFGDADRSAVGRRVVAGIGAVALALPALAQVQVFPYSYAYANELVDWQDLPHTDDFWQASAREVADSVPPGSYVVCGAERDEQDRPLRRMPNGGQSWLAVGDDCGRRALGVMSPYVDHPADPRVVEDRFVAMLVSDPERVSGCEPLATITRPRLLGRAVLSTAWDCPVLLPEYDGPIVLDGAGTGFAHLMGGWTGNGGADAATVEDVASLGFRRTGAAGGFELRVLGTSMAEPSFLVNAVAFPATRDEDGWTVPVDEAPSWGRGGDVVLTIEAGGAPVQVRGVEMRSR